MLCSSTVVCVSIKGQTPNSFSPLRCAIQDSDGDACYTRRELGNSTAGPFSVSADDLRDELSPSRVKGPRDGRLGPGPEKNQKNKSGKVGFGIGPPFGALGCSWGALQGVLGALGCVLGHSCCAL